MRKFLRALKNDYLIWKSNWYSKRLQNKWRLMTEEEREELHKLFSGGFRHDSLEKSVQLMKKLLKKYQKR